MALGQGFSAFVYCITGAYVILVAAVRAVGGDASVIGWTLAAYSVGGGATVLASVVWRQPVGIGWSVAGTAVIAGGAMRATGAEFAASYIVVGCMMLALGAVGAARWLLEVFPSSVVWATMLVALAPLMWEGAVAAVTNVWGAIIVAIAIAAMVVRRWSGVGPPPVVAAAAVVPVYLGVGTRSVSATVVSSAHLVSPSFAAGPLLRIVPVMFVLAFGVHTAQGLEILRVEGYRVHYNWCSALAGVVSLPMAMLGCVPGCVMGPAVGILNAKGRREIRYLGSAVLGALLVLFGVGDVYAGSFVLALPEQLMASLAAVAIAPVVVRAVVVLGRDVGSIGGAVPTVVIGLVGMGPVVPGPIAVAIGCGIVCDVAWRRMVRRRGACRRERGANRRGGGPP